MVKMAYVYRHIRLDNNTPFYIGIGSDISYKRAYKIKGRSFRWKDIAYKIPYKVEIILDNLTWEEACYKEIEFISLYGRIDLGTGILTNMTDGGGGTTGHKWSINQNKALHKRLKGNKYNLGNKYSPEVKKLLSDIRKNIPQPHLRKSIMCLNNNIIYESVSIAANELNLKQGDISNVLTNKQKTTKGYKFIYS
jgi:hypothetical protein